jgi:hypothetical protein
VLSGTKEMARTMTMASSEADSNLWRDIRESVAEYCDERAPAGDWHISRDLLSSDVLAFNFFFPLRQDIEGLSRALSALRGQRTRVDSLDVLPPTMTESMGAPDVRPISNVAMTYRDDHGGGLLLLKCTFTELALGACPSRTGFRPDDCRGRGADAADACSVSWRCPYLEPLSPSHEGSPQEAASSACPFAEGGHQVLRGLLLARTMAAAWNAHTVEFGVVYDGRNAELTSLVGRWNSRVRLATWSYQAVLSALGSRNVRRMGPWRAFVRERYGLVPVAPRGDSSERDPHIGGQPDDEEPKGTL